MFTKQDTEEMVKAANKDLQTLQRQVEMIRRFESVLRCHGVDACEDCDTEVTLKGSYLKNAEYALNHGWKTLIEERYEVAGTYVHHFILCKKCFEKRERKRNG